MDKPSRRNFIKSCVAAGMGAGLVQGQTEEYISTIRPGDVLVHAQKFEPTAFKPGTPIKPSEVIFNKSPLLALPLRSGQPVENADANYVYVMRVKESRMSSETRNKSVDGGILVYSAICTHLGCMNSSRTDIFMDWSQEDLQYMVCPCHTARFDPAKAGIEIDNRYRPVQLLTIKVKDNQIVVAKGFAKPVGPRT
jgi:rieske iron-sulfur protein